MSNKSYIPTRDHLPTKVTIDIDFTDETVVHCDVPVAKKDVCR